MDEDIREAIRVAKAVSVVVTIAWFVANCMTMLGGIAEAYNGVRLHDMRRVELVVPGYQIGYWLGSPIHPKETK